MVRWEPRRTTGYAVGMVTDSHISASVGAANVLTSLDWLRSQDPKPRAILHAGDINEVPAAASSFSTWITEQSGWPDPEIEFLYTIGNHDAEIPWGGPYGITPAAPHASIVARHARLFRGREWYHRDIESTRVIVINNLTDCLHETTGRSCYYNCNPPGAEYEVNPDHGGISIEGSPQRAWLEAVANSDHLWKIVVGHRALWTPYDADWRPMNRLARPALRTPIDHGVSLVFTGDVHVGALSGPWYPAEPENEETRDPGQVGAYSLSLAGGYVVRSVDVSRLPGYTGGDVNDAANSTTVHWADGNDNHPGDQHLCHAAHLTFAGDEAYLQIFACSDLNPIGGVVHTQTLRRNPGAV